MSVPGVVFFGLFTQAAHQPEFAGHHSKGRNAVTNQFYTIICFPIFFWLSSPRLSQMVAFWRLNKRHFSPLLTFGKVSFRNFPSHFIEKCPHSKSLQNYMAFSTYRKCAKMLTITAKYNGSSCSASMSPKGCDAQLGN